MANLTAGQIEQIWIKNGGTPKWASTMAGIALAESSGHTTAFNTNPGTGDKSVGLWQINYYQGLTKPRTAQYGSSTHLRGTVTAQAKAAISILGGGPGITAWTGDPVGQLAINNNKQPVSTATITGALTSSGRATNAALNGLGSGGSGASATATATAKAAAKNAAAAKATAQATTAGVAAATLKTALRTANLTGLATWATKLTTQLAAQGLSSSAISQEVTLQLYTQPTFKKAFPGMTLRKQNGYGAMSIAEYLTYADKAKQMARAAGIPTTMMSTTEIGKLIGNDVSATELSDRITNGYQVIATAPQQTKDLFTQYYGVKSGTLVGYFLTPQKAEPALVNQVTAAQIGTEGVSSGFGNLPKTQAQYLQQMGVNQATARTTFKGLSKLTPLMTALPGTGGEKTSISQSDLVNYGFFGTNQNELQAVEGARKAPFEGGGGYVQGAKGILGAGYGSSEGQQGT